MKDVSDRETVREVAEENPSIFAVSPCGPGVMLLYRSDMVSGDATVTRGYTDMWEEHGWYVSHYRPSDTGDMAIIMPAEWGGSDA